MQAQESTESEESPPADEGDEPGADDESDGALGEPEAPAGTGEDAPATEQPAVVEEPAAGIETADSEQDPAAAPEAAAPEQEPAAEPAATAPAEDLDAMATAAAQDAATTHAELCAQIWRRNVDMAAESMATVSQQWGRVSEVLGKTSRGYLFYWRAMLAECLGQDELALADFETFIGHEDSLQSPSMVNDAEWRVKRIVRRSGGQGGAERGRGLMTRQSRARRRARGALGVGVGLFVVALAPTALSAFAWDSAVRSNEVLHNEPPPEDGWKNRIDDIEDEVEASRFMGAVALGFAAGGVISFVSAGALSSGGRPRVAGSIGPRGRDGVQAGLSVRW